MNKSIAISQKQFESRIYTIRGVQVMIDYHLAELFNVETKRLNEQVKRNTKRFSISFMFKLSHTEWDNLRSQFATAEKATIPYIFTSILKSISNE